MLVVGTWIVIEIELFEATLCEITCGAFPKATGEPTGCDGSFSGAFSTNPSFGVAFSVGES